MTGKRNLKSTLYDNNRLILGIATGIILFFSATNTNNVDIASVKNVEQVQTTTVQFLNKGKKISDTPEVSEVVSDSILLTKKQVFVEEEVRAYFEDTPQLIAVAWCESRFRQNDKNGDTFRGIVNNKDVGVMQINEYYHADQALKKGYNLYTTRGNMAYAKDLYERQGLQPWISSKPCWGEKVANGELAFAEKQ